MVGSKPDVCWDLAGDGVVPYYTNGTMINASSLVGFTFISYTGVLYTIGNTAISPSVLYPYFAGTCTGATLFVSALPNTFNEQSNYATIYPPMDAALNAVPYTQFVADVANQLYRPSPSATNVFDPRIGCFTSNATVPSLLKRSLPDYQEIQTETVKTLEESEKTDITNKQDKPRTETYNKPLSKVPEAVILAFAALFLVAIIAIAVAMYIGVRNRNNL